MGRAPPLSFSLSDGRRKTNVAVRLLKTED